MSRAFVILRLVLVAAASVCALAGAVTTAVAAGDAAGATRTDAITAAVAAGDKRYAILVGVGDYKQAPPVAYVKQNLDQMERLLVDVFFVKEANIRRIEDPDRLDLAEIFGFDKGAPGNLAGLDIRDEDAELFVYFVGHGSRDLHAAGTSDAAAAEGYLLATNSRPSTLRHTAYSYDTLIENLDRAQKQRFPAGRVVVFMESCFSGETADGEPLNPSMAAALLAPSEGWDERAEKFDVVSVSAAAADTPAYWDEEREEGVFTGALVTGLRGRADASAGNGDGTVTFEELRAWLASAVPSRTARLGKSRQTPQVSTNAAGAIVHLASLDTGGDGRRTDSVEDLSLEFELRELSLRATQIDAKDWPALEMLESDLDAFVDRCGGDACRVFLPTIIPLRSDTDARLSRCAAASEIAGRWIRESAFRSVARLDALCVTPATVEACVAGEDPQSRACRCVADPVADGCGRSEADTCEADFAAARDAAAALPGLTPFDDFAAAAPQSCLTALAEPLRRAREAVCAANESDTTPVPAALAACPWAVALTERETERAACSEAYAAARDGPAEALAAFLVEHSACPHYANAIAERDGRINRAIVAAEAAEGEAEREAAARTLDALATAFSATLSDAAMARLGDIGETLAVPTCASAFRDAERGGPAALTRFATERPECAAEVATARDTLARKRCQDAFAAIDRTDAADLYRFAQGNASCAAESAVAERMIETIGRNCISKAQSSIGTSLEAVNAALESLGLCRRVTLLSDGLAEPYGDAEKALRALQHVLTIAAANASGSGSASDANRYGASAYSGTDTGTAVPRYQNGRPYDAPAGNGGSDTGRQVALYSGVDFYGADLTQRGVDAYSTMECAGICASNARCSHFTYNTKANRCFPKYGIGRVVAFTGAASGMILYPGQNAPSLRDDHGRVANATRMNQVY